MIRTQIQLTEQQARALKELASKRDVSMAELVREGVEHVLRSEHPVDDEALRRRALAAIGQFHSGTSDLSSEHDKYLAEVYGS